MAEIVAMAAACLAQSQLIGLSCGYGQSRRISSARKPVSKTREWKFLTIGFFLLCLALPAPTRAQNEAPAPFDGDLERLGEILGALHYLRAICGANEGPKSRNEIRP